MMKGIYLYMAMCIAAIALTACTNELEESTVPADVLVLTVGGFPAFQETPETRAVGTFDPGKTEWENGDKILVCVSSNGSTTQYATLTYENNTWTPSQTLTRPSSAYTINAWYAPAYEWNNGTLSLLSGKQAGTDKFLATTSSDVTITFTTNDRRYSRLRIAGSPGTNLSVSLTDFTPAGNNTSSGTTNIDLTTDDKGNAYLYGTWTENSNLDVTYGSQSLVNKDNITASVANTSYVVDASFATIFPDPTKCNEIGDGSTYPYILLNGAQLNDLATNNNANKGAQYKMAADIDLSQYSSTWTPFTFSGTFDGNGHAITSFTYSGSTQNFGLFNQNSGIIKNLIIEECSITNTGTGGTAAIAYNNVGTIENCHVSGTIGGYNVSGIAETNNGSIIACSNSATLSGTYVCGISRNIENGATFIGCYNTGILNGSSGYTGIWRIPLSTPTGTVTTLSCYASVGDIYNNPAMFTNNISSCYYLNNNVITDQGNGSTVADWQTAIENMNSTLQQGGYNYRYEMGTGGLPVINNQ